MRLIRPILAVLCGLLFSSVPASAQIYAWRDVHGTLVLSDRKLVEGAETFAVPATPDIRATTPASDGAEDRFENLVREHASKQSLRPDLVRAVIQVESGFNPMARSPKGAMGLMQLMPATAMLMGVRNPYDPGESIRGGTAYLRLLLDRFNGSEELALAAYNAGSGAVERYGFRIPPYKETRDYVRKIGSAVGGTRKQAPAVRQPGLSVYKTFEIVDGRMVPRYSTVKPAVGSYEIVTQ